MYNASLFTLVQHKMQLLDKKSAIWAFQNNFIDDPISDERNRFDFDGVDDHVNINVPNISGTASIITVEVLAKLTIDLDTADSEGYMIFGWSEYSVWTGPITGDGTPFALGFNTGNSDLYGLSSTRVNNLGLNNNFIHYICPNHEFYRDAIAVNMCKKL